MNFFRANCDLNGIYTDLEKHGITLSDLERKKINTIFNECDVYNDARKSNGKDGRLNNKEIANFLMKISAVIPKIREKIFSSRNYEKEINDRLKQEPDALRVKKAPMLVKAESNLNIAETAKITSDVQTLVEKGAKAHGNNLSEEKIKEITSMVVQLCRKYKISDLAPVITQILSNETGGFVFNDKVLKNSGKSFKGCMQVDLETCCCIYGMSQSSFKDFDGKMRQSKAKKQVYEYDQQHHFSQDMDRIKELKKKYPTPKALYQAIQKDVALGLEVGIIAFKAKLSYSKGSVSGAVSQYCGNQYRTNLTGVPQKVNVKERA